MNLVMLVIDEAKEGGEDKAEWFTADIWPSALLREGAGRPRAAMVQ
ncbi:hypothetical protein KTAU_14180 [Thermogemmatispora aurantia]|jgi:hypothetical protein|uniref:Uncharacterized protein n=1 Tax=Thermogemmatispora aurantia TaxID=2045279 RepID=A0A5J4K7Y1_9CHLR|nr:hypothetical protein KTAU_14180 [Thermogemmatispora aurantia]